MGLKETSKYISLILRHKPETIGITLDEHGWANVDELISGIAKTHEMNMNILEEIVSTDEKQRYSFNDDKTKNTSKSGTLYSGRCRTGRDETTGNTLAWNW